MNAEYWSQVGFGIVAAAFGWWAWHLWQTLNAERDKTALLHREHQVCQQVLMDRLSVLAQNATLSIEQTSAALKELREALEIYDKFYSRQPRSAGRSSKPKLV